MKIIPFVLCAVLTCSFIIPVPTNQERCMVIYSINEEDTIKISIKFPKDPQVEQFYDYFSYIKDLSGNIIQQEQIYNRHYKTEIIVPNKTIYESCIRVSPNDTKAGNLTNRYQGEILIDYEANTHFMVDHFKSPLITDIIKDEEISYLKMQANQVLNATQQYLKIQSNKQQSSNNEFQDRRERSDSLFEWWMIELVVILGIGAFQWFRMSKKLQSSSY